MRIKDQNKYDAIINASIHQFRKEGFAKASINKIAKEADVSPGTIYIYFDNKEDLIEKLYLLLRKEMCDIVLGDIQLEGCFESAYKKMWLNYYHYCLNHYEAFDYIMQYTHSPFGKRVSSDTDVCYFNKIYALFKIGKDQAVLKNISDEILFAYTFYPASQLAKRHLCCGSKLSKAQVEDACKVAWDAVSQRKGQVSCKKLTQSLTERLVGLFQKGEKKVQMLGVEFEHFLVDKESLRSYDYFEPFGQMEIAKKLVESGWQVAYEENGYILHLTKNNNSISFEPGGQFEISLRPCATISSIDQTYRQVMEEIESVLMPNQMLVSLGYHPHSQIETLSLLPKRRYKFMYDYLHTQGTMARNMMKGTASTQVSIDYESEEDFIKKYRVANFLSPFISKLFDASPVFEGQLYPERNLRNTIWEHTDLKRSKMPEGVLSTRFDYTSYAQYVESIEPILMVKKDEIYSTGDDTLKALSKRFYLSDEELLHGMSMVFPDVRLKNFMEIRMADALPYPYNLAVPALIKGIFYNETMLEKYYLMSLDYREEDIRALDVKFKSYDDFKYETDRVSLQCHPFIENLLEDAMASLEEDAGYLSAFYEFYKKHGGMTNHMKTLYGSDAFGRFIKGGL
jgi:glutamate--cysteine ligase